MVKPSSPTPPHLQTLKLSYLDQLCYSFYVPLVFYYSANKNRAIPSDDELDRTSRRLTQSLSQTLTSFYPFAGRSCDFYTVDCNDAGAELSFARVTGLCLDEAARDPESVERYLPAGPTDFSGIPSHPVFLARVTFFPCGGSAVGIRFSHHVADAASAAAFVAAWAAGGDGCSLDDHFLDFNLSSDFPAREFPPPAAATVTGSDESFRTARFAFDEAKLAALRRVAGGGSAVVLVSAFIWESFMRANEKDDEKVFVATHRVDLRSRKKALEKKFGNCFMTSFAYCTAGREFHELVGKLRESIRKVDEGYITGSKNDGDVYMGDVRGCMSKLVKGEVEGFLFPSWCGFPFYEVDFGWGRPVRVCTTPFPAKNGAILMDMNRLEGDDMGKGIEAWVCMTNGDLEIFEKNFKLLVSGGGATRTQRGRELSNLISHKARRRRECPQPRVNELLFQRRGGDLEGVGGAATIGEDERGFRGEELEKI
ncbi:HXXXD-type acyl-transferase family protein [Striga hermonthica]|uniref:HXXXD-type acyl-transferase family protein n=1 Tax=Striga hermonthica TaxID=68872 RepID=A0A9N7NYG0_STRHE|nr:HXXXD-type acyl-transferase family protein [Striga hermonthica]